MHFLYHTPLKCLRISTYTTMYWGKCLWIHLRDRVKSSLEVKRYYWLVVAEVYGEVSAERQTNQCTCDWLESSIRVITK